MKKLLIILISIIALVSLISCSKNKNDNAAATVISLEDNVVLSEEYKWLLEDKWELNINNVNHGPVIITFYENCKYRLFSPGMECFSKFEIEDNKIFLSEPETLTWELLKELFVNGELVLELDGNYEDFYSTEVLYNDKVIVRNPTKLNKEEGKYIIDGIEVIKIKSIEITPKENVTLRSGPSVESEKKYFNYRTLFHYKYFEYNNENNIGVNIDEEARLSVLLKGMTASCDCYTVETSTIDGITAPWYRIAVNTYDFDDGMSSYQYFWVFGGYIEEYDGRNLDDVLIKQGFERNILFYLDE